MLNTKKLPHYLILAASVAALAACQANGGGPGSGSSGGSNGSVASDDGIGPDGSISGDGSNSDTGFPNDPLGPGGGDVGGSIVEAGVDENGDPVDNEVAYGDSGKRFMCLSSANANAGATTEATANGLVGGVVGGILGAIGGDSVIALTNSVKDQPYAIDSDLKTASVFTLTASLLEIIGSGAIDSLEQQITLASPTGGYAVAALSFPAGAVDLGLLKTVTITTFLDTGSEPSTEPAEPPVTFDATSVDLLGQSLLNPGYAFVGRKVTQPYNRVHVGLQGDFLSADVGEAMYLHEVCTAGTLVDAPVEP